jgi:hypothetical protein
MKRKLIAIVLAVCIGFLTACSPETPEPSTRKEITVEATPTMDFYNIGAYPRAEQIQPLDQVTKLVFMENAGQPGGICVAIDLGNRAMYSNAEIHLIGLNEPDISLADADIVQLLDILVKYDVQGWNAAYLPEDTNFLDGFGWSLSLEYEDRTVENHYGAGSENDDIFPASYDAFLEELLAFRDARIG